MNAVVWWPQKGYRVYLGSLILAYHISKGYFSIEQWFSFFVVCGYHWLNHWWIRNYIVQLIISLNIINVLMIVNLRLRVTLTGVLKLPMMLLAQMVLWTAKLHTSLEFIGSSKEHVAEDISILVGCWLTQVPQFDSMRYWRVEQSGCIEFQLNVSWFDVTCVNWISFGGGRGSIMWGAIQGMIRNRNSSLSLSLSALRVVKFIRAACVYASTCFYTVYKAITCYRNCCRIDDIEDTCIRAVHTLHRPPNQSRSRAIGDVHL